MYDKNKQSRVGGWRGGGIKGWARVRADTPQHGNGCLVIVR